jgi:hypothetical protein
VALGTTSSVRAETIGGASPSADELTLAEVISLARAHTPQVLVGDLTPVRIVRRRRSAVDGRDCRFRDERTRVAQRERVIEKLERAEDCSWFHRGAVLFRKWYGVAVCVAPGASLELDQ